MNAKVAEENKIYDDTRRGCNLSADGQRPPHARSNGCECKRKKMNYRAIANLFDSLRGKLATISPSRKMTCDDTTNMKVK